MKNFLLLAATAFSLAAGAQNKEGRVIYERTMQMGNMRFGGDLPPEVRTQMERAPKSRTEQLELLFSPEHSLFQTLPNAAEDENDRTFSGGGMTIQMRRNTNEVSYVHFANGTRIDQREILEKSFVVVDSVQKLQWKLSAETKPILNFTTRKATASSVVSRPRMTMENGIMKRETLTDTVPVVAWFTTEIPVPTGPSFQGQLPGLILELDVNNGQNVTRAIEFSPKVALSKIKQPKDGKQLTAIEFEKERNAMMEEMRRNMPAGRTIRMQ